MRTLSLLPLLLLAACGRDPTLLADMGDVTVSVNYGLGPDGPGSVEVRLDPAEGCPTFVGDAALNGEALLVEEAGRTETGGYYFVPVARCEKPYLTLGAPGIGADEPMSLVFEDESDTWEVGADEAFTMAYAAPDGPARPGGTIELPWSGPTPGNVFVTVWQDDRGVNGAFSAVAEDGSVSVHLPNDLGASPIVVNVDADVGLRVDTCDGFAQCRVKARYGDSFELEVVR